jgi:hypothetical protein
MTGGKRPGLIKLHPLNIAKGLSTQTLTYAAENSNKRSDKRTAMSDKFDFAPDAPIIHPQL